MDEFGYDSGSDWDEAGPSQSSWFFEEDVSVLGHGRRSKRAMSKVDSSMAKDLFGVSVAGVLGGGMSGVGRGGAGPVPGIVGRGGRYLHFP